MRQVRKNERGFSLLIGMSILILMTVLGITVMQAVNSDIETAGNDRGAQSALAIAEAGLAWAIDYLQGKYGLDSATEETFTNIVENSYGDLSNYSDGTVEEKTACDVPNDPCVQSEWKIVTHNRSSAEKSFGGGRYIVWVGRDPADANKKTLLLRSLGIDSRGSQRLIEIAVTAGADQTL